MTTKIILFAFSSFILFSSCQDTVNNTPVVQETPEENEEYSTTEEKVTDSIFIVIDDYMHLDSLFDQYEYSLANVRASNEVPRFFVHEIKKSLALESSNTRKFDFIRIILANALKVNEDILAERARVLKYTEQSSLSKSDSLDLNSLLTKYKAKTNSELLDKVNIIPPSLILCQAIIESGWGKSHFASDGNSLFGEHARVGSPHSIKAKGANIALHTFPSIYFAVQSYVLNLNHNGAYKSLRAARTELIKNNQPINGISLANTQDHYSEKGHEYAEYLKRVISLYHLGDFDDCILKNEPNKIIIIKK